MAYNTRAIKLDVNSKPIPQYYNAEVDDYEVLQGKNGANRVMLYDAVGNPLLTSSNAGYVRAEDGMIAALGALADAAQTDPAAAASVISILKGLLTRLADPATAAKQDAAKAVLTAIRDTAGIKKVVDPVDVSDRSTRQLGQVTLSGSAVLTDQATNISVAAGAYVNVPWPVLTTYVSAGNYKSACVTVRWDASFTNSLSLGFLDSTGVGVGPSESLVAPGQRSDLVSPNFSIQRAAKFRVILYNGDAVSHTATRCELRMFAA